MRAVVVAALLAWPATARAQSSEVASLLREGVRLRIEGHDGEALTRFTDAYDRCHCAEARAQMGLAAQALGRFAVADAWLTEALAAEGDRWVQANHAELEAARGEVRARAASLVVRGEAGASVRVDDEARGETDAAGELAVRVDAGRHRVVLAASDGRRAEGSVEAIAGGESTLRVALPPRVVAPTPVVLREPAPRTSGWRRAAPWVALAGAASVLAGGVTLAFEQRYTSLWNSSDCLAGNRTREDNCGPWRASAERAEAATIASWAVGGALLVAAAGMWWLAPRAAPRVSLRCGPTGLTGVACGGTF